MNMTRMIATAVVLSMSTLTFAQEQPANAGQEVLKRMSAHFVEAKSFAVNVGITMNVDVNGAKEQNQAAVALAVAKPNKFRVAFQSPDGGGLTVNDGTTTTTYIGAMKQYQAQPTNADAPLQHQLMGVLLNGSLVQDDPYSKMTETATSVSHHGTAKVREQDCDIVRMITPDGTVDIYVQQGDKPIPLQVVADQSMALRARGAQGSVIITMDYTDWKVSEALPDDTFVFTAPEGAREVKQFRQPQPSDAMLGKEAPAFELTSHADAEKTIKLADLKGKVVVLDFWATWCGPCVAAMPVIKKATDDLADKDVVLYTINLRENEDQVKAFIEKHELGQLNVLMDRDAAVSQRYRVRGIPHTVIIGKDGTIQAIHVGFGPGTGEQLRDELAKLVAGESLVE